MQSVKNYLITASLAGFLIFTASLANAQALPDFTGLIDDKSAAVVNISTSSNLSGVLPYQMPGFPDMPEKSPFYEFFKKYFGEMPEQSSPFGERSSLGSGFIISKDGYVITNHHVVKGATEIIVSLNNQREYTAELVGSDARSDIALLKVNAKENLPILRFGDTSKLKVGQWVLAIGSPFGFDYSATAGIISAIGRSLPRENYVPFIQTDVVINPGNSGGPLFNLAGEVIGVNSQIYSPTGVFMGLSFSVPADVVENVYKQLRDKGRVSRGWLGVLIQDITRNLAESFDMEYPHGALISKVIKGSPAEKAGIEVGDVIVKFNGEKIDFSSELPPLVGNTPVGDTVSIEILRRSRHKTLWLTVSELPGDDIIAGNNGSGKKSRYNLLNIVVKDLSEKQKKELQSEHGILVERVDEGPAQKAGIRDGDIILLMNNVKIRDIEHFNQLLDGLSRNRSVPVLIQRRGGPIFLALMIEDE